MLLFLPGAAKDGRFIESDPALSRGGPRHGVRAHGRLLRPAFGELGRALQRHARASGKRARTCPA